jgi:hypothetical protein
MDGGSRAVGYQLLAISPLPGTYPGSGEQTGLDERLCLLNS